MSRLTDRTDNENFWRILGGCLLWATLLGTLALIWWSAA